VRSDDPQLIGISTTKIRELIEEAVQPTLKIVNCMAEEASCSDSATEGLSLRGRVTNVFQPERLLK
jgi:hypothetical protein